MRSTPTAGRLGGFAGLTFAALLLTFFAPGALAQTWDSESDRVAYTDAVGLEAEVGQFLKNPDASWFNSRKERIDALVDRLAVHFSGIAKDPERLSTLSPCDHAKAAIELAIVHARVQFRIVQDARKAKAALEGSSLDSYAESIRQCEVIARIRNRAENSTVIGKNVRCLEMGVDCPK